MTHFMDCPRVWAVTRFRRPLKHGDPPLCSIKNLASTHLFHGTLTQAFLSEGFSPPTVTEWSILDKRGKLSTSKVDLKAHQVVFFDQQ